MAEAGWFDEAGPVFRWWQELHGWRGDTLAGLVPAEPAPGKRGELAELKRAQTAGELIVSCRAYHDLRRRTGARDDERLAAVARVLARVRHPGEDSSFARLVARPRGEGDKPVVSELRFKRLLRIDGDWQALADVLLRLLPLADHSANPLTLARDVWWWGDKTRRRWATEYYEVLLDSRS